MRLKLFSFFVLVCGAVSAQTFTEVPINAPGVMGGYSSWVDYDNDGDLDFSLIGHTNDGDILRLFKNDNGSYSSVSSISNIGTTLKGLDWGDYDKDGDIDMVLGNIVYENTGNDLFVKKDFGFEEIDRGPSSWGDFDHDGDLDLLSSGLSSNNALVTKIYSSNLNVLTETTFEIKGVTNVAEWGDYDNDGDLDVFVMGSYDGTLDPTAIIYQNNDSVFVESFSIPNLCDLVTNSWSYPNIGSAKWGDYDNDGDLDIIATGLTYPINGKIESITKIYKNDAGVFTDSGIPLTGIDEAPNLGWVDINNDGYLDIMLTGRYNKKPLTEIYINKQNDTFEKIETGIINVFGASFDWNDINNDGKLDLLLTGYSENEGVFLKIYKQDDKPIFTLSKIDIAVDEDFNVKKSIDIIPDHHIDVTYSIEPSSVSFANVTIDPVTGALSISAIADSNGTQEFTVIATDKSLATNTYSQKFTLTVTPVNDVPAFTLSESSINIYEDFSDPVTVSLQSAHVPNNELSQNLIYTISPESVTFATIEFDKTTGKTVVTAIADSNGTQEFTITANDGQSDNNLYSQTFSLGITPVTDGPIFTLNENAVVADEDFKETFAVYPRLVGKQIDERSLVPYYTISPSSVSFAQIVFNDNGNVNISALPDSIGTQEFTLTAHVQIPAGDPGISEYSQTFTLTVNPVNDAPAFSLSETAVTAIEDFAVPLTVSVQMAHKQLDEISQKLNFTISPESVTFATIDFDKTTGKTVVTAIADSNGTQEFTITANDGQAENNLYSQTFTLNVTPVNDIPEFGLSESNIAVNEDFQEPIAVTVAAKAVPVNEQSQTVSYSIVPATVSFADISFDAATGKTIITAIADSIGNQKFTVTANDGQSAQNTFSQSFTFAVKSVNDAPAFVLDQPVVTVDEDFKEPVLVSAHLSNVQKDEVSQRVSYTILPKSVKFATIDFDRITGELSISAVADSNGVQEFTITANDGESSNNLFSQKFTLTVNPVNDAPTFALSQNTITADEDFAGSLTVTAKAEVKQLDETAQTITYSISLAVPSIAKLVFNPATGMAQFTSVVDSNGVQEFTITANDGQSANNLFSQKFTLTLNPTYDRPGCTKLTPAICMVGVDSLNHNMVVWSDYRRSAFDSIVVYRQSGQSDIYERIGARSTEGANVFVDSASNPAESSSRYKLVAIDTCGFPTEYSAFHKTIHLTINEGLDGVINLIWDGYEGFEFKTYRIYRAVEGQELAMIAERASNTFTYSDLTPPTGNLSYMIEVVNPSPCTISSLKSSWDYYGTTCSNIAKRTGTVSSAERNGNSVSVEPNPAKDVVTVTVQNLGANAELVITSDGGKLVLKTKLDTTSTKIDMSSFATGMYIFTINGATGTANTKVVKE